MVTLTPALKRRLELREVPLRNGDEMDRATFHQLYLNTPQGFRAELIGGVVHVASPTSFRHGRPHLRMLHWIGTYIEETPGTDACSTTTTFLSEDDEPEPDVTLFIDPDCGGQLTIDRDGFLVGAAELVVEVGYSSASIDMNAKRRQYESAGVGEYIVVLVERQEVVWFQRAGQGFVQAKPDKDGVIRSRVFPGLQLIPVTVFDKNGRRLIQCLQQGLATPEHAAFVAKLETQRAKRKPKANGKKRGAK